MPAKNKTTHTEASVTDFIHSFVEKEEKKQDSFRIIQLMQQWSGFEPKMYGPTIIGFGNYHYKYASGREGDAPLIAFSPRKADITFYVTIPSEDNKALLDQLGRFKMSKSCIYVKKLDDIDVCILEKLCKAAIKYHHDNNDCGCR